jgi:hypothetical protein
LERHKADVLIPGFAASGPAVLAARRDDRQDTAHGGEVGRKRGRTNAKWIEATSE